MSKVLVTLLGTEAEVLKASHFINSLTKENPHSEVHVLTYKDFSSVVALVANVSQAHYIDREQISNTKESKLFSDAFAINSLFDSIKECTDIEWNKVINFSNDSTSAYIASIISANEVLGTTISNIGSPLTSNNWATYLNFVNSQKDFHVISNNQVRHHLANMPYYKEGNKVKVNEEYSAIANQNFAKIRKSKPTTANANIVGISLARSSAGEEIDFHSLYEIIDTLETSERYKPVLLITGSAQEKEMANELNYKFDNKLISINTDLTAYPSVIMNVDALITARNNHLTIADTLETRIIEVAPNSESTTATACVNPGNFVIVQSGLENIVNDVNFILNQEFETDLPVSSMNSVNKTYAQVEDDYGTLTTQVRGDLNIQQELRYHIERCFHYQLMGYEVNYELISHIKEHTQKEDLNEFVGQVKDELTNTVKILLATLRSLKGVKQSKNNLQNFIGYLDTLIMKGKTNSITSGAIALFEGHIENINASNSDDNIKAIETNLFNLKNNLQLLANILTGLVTETQKDTTTTINA